MSDFVTRMFTGILYALILTSVMACAPTANPPTVKVVEQFYYADDSFKITFDITNNSGLRERYDFTSSGNTNVNGAVTVSPTRAALANGGSTRVMVTGRFKANCQTGTINLTATGTVSSQTNSGSTSYKPNFRITAPAMVKADKNTAEFRIPISLTCCPGIQGTFKISESGAGMGFADVKITPTKITCPVNGGGPAAVVIKGKLEQTESIMEVVVRPDGGGQGTFIKTKVVSP